MRRQSTLAAVVTGLALAALPAVVVAQSPERTNEFSLPVRMGINFLAVLIANLLVGSIMVVLKPEYTTSRLREINEKPGETFGWGLIVGILVPVLLVILAMTIIGLVVAIPGAILLFVVSLVGQGVTAAWVGNGLVGDPSGVDVTQVGVGALALAIPGAIPVLGNLVTSIVGLFGLGAVGRQLYLDY